MNIKEFINSRSKSLNQAAIILAVSAFLSLVLGLLRDRLLAGTFGAGRDLSVYYAAFSIPDFVFNILFAGSIVVAFLPVFAEHYSRDEKEAWRMANYVLNSFLFFTLVISALLFIFAPQAIGIIVPGFDASAQAETVGLTRLMLLSPIFFGLSSFFSSVLQYFKRFLAYSFAPILYNLGIIFGVIFLTPSMGVFGAGIGVVLGSAAHLLVQIPAALKCGFKYQPLFDLKYPAVFQIINLTFFRSLAASLSQINFMVINSIASKISLGAVAVFKLSFNLSFFPIGILGVSLATAAFPGLAQNWVDGKKQEFYKNFSSAFRQILYISLPAGILFFVLREPMVRFILQTGQFGMRDAALTAACLGIYSFTILPQCLVPLVLRGFFSAKDTRTPVILAFFFVAFNVLLSLGLVALAGGANFFSAALKSVFGFNFVQPGTLQMLALCIAFSAALMFQFIIFMVFLYKKIGDFGIEEIAISFGKMFLAGSVSFFFGTWFLPIANDFFGQGLRGNFLQLAGVGGAGFLLYFLVTLALRSSEANAFTASVLNRFKKYGKPKTN
ncbi:MAG: murein biosynthesis integral membrane protein MurJ [Candidatus Paceibacterota bacterium]|jgi:putative peptidoglycan lipid II flippase